VNFYRTTETEIQRLYSLNSESLVVAVSYPKHIKGTLKFTRQAQSQGAKVIAVTESELNALSLEAEIPFIVDVNVDDETCFSPMSETMVLFHLILMCVKAKNKDKTLESIKNINTNLEKEDIYI
jgi:DNA-binding MurR/RpiR family transcriptional regulator